jgi:hypothetical protein
MLWLSKVRLSSIRLLTTYQDNLGQGRTGETDWKGKGRLRTVQLCQNISVQGKSRQVNIG